MINIKADKNMNNAVSAINILYNDYVVNNPKQEKCFLILKIKYDFIISKKDNEKKIYIKSINSYFLDEIDLSKEHKQDYRNWTNKFNPNSGRLQISDNFIKTHLLDKSKISYQNTCNCLKSIIERNKKI